MFLFHRYADIFKSLLKLTAAILVFLFGSCTKDIQHAGPRPEISFLSASPFLSHDTSLLINEQAQIGIFARSKSGAELTQLSVININDGVISAFDTGIYLPEISYTQRFSKGISQNESWLFYVRDRNGNQSDTISIHFSQSDSSEFGSILTISSLRLGAQNQQQIGGFFSFETQNVWSLEEAFGHQAQCDLLYFYDAIETDANTIASPGANIDASVFSGDYSLNNWQVKNTVRFEQLSEISVTDFQNCTNDSLILATTFNFPVGKRKAKNLAPGQLFAFVSETGVKGLFAVNQVEGQEAGFVEITLKMQEQ